MRSILWVVTHKEWHCVEETLSLVGTKDKHHLLLLNRHKVFLPKSIASRFESVLTYDDKFVGLTGWLNAIVPKNIALVNQLYQMRFDACLLVRDGFGIHMQVMLMIERLVKKRGIEYISYDKALLSEGHYAKDSQFWYLIREPFLNEQGFRGPILHTQKLEAEFRIFCLGGSTTYGSGAKEKNLQIDWDETYPFHLECILKEAIIGESHNDVRVANLGITGMSSGALLHRLRDNLLHVPDIVVVHSGYNDMPIITDEKNGCYQLVCPDVNSPENFQWIVDQYRNHRKRRKILRRRHPGDTGDFAGKNIFLGFDIQESETVSGGEDLVELEFERRTAKYLANMQQLVSYCLDRGVGVVCCLQPPILPDHFVFNSSFRSPKSTALISKLHLCQQQRLADAMHHFSSHQDFYVVDLTKAFGDKCETNYIDELHLNSDGNKLVAEVLAPVLLTMLKKRTPRLAPFPAEDTLSGKQSTKWSIRTLDTLVSWKSGKRLRLSSNKQAPRNQSPFMYPHW